MASKQAAQPLYSLYGGIFALMVSLVIALSTLIPAPTAYTPLTKEDIAAYAPNEGLSDRDIARYQAIFSLQKDGNWDEADKVISSLQDTTLLGAILAQRYLHQDYVSDYQELAAWLKQYNDMPEASRIYRLAQRKRPVGTLAPMRYTTAKALTGDGNARKITGTRPGTFMTGLNYWQRGELDNALTFFKAAHKHANGEWHKAAALYWQARVLDKQGHEEQAKTAFSRAADYPRTFYGLLAAKQTGQATLARMDAPSISASVLKKPATKRALAFAAIGKHKRAESELRILFNSVNNAQRAELISLAASLDMPALQLRLGNYFSYKGTEYDLANYPAPRWLEEHKYLVDPALIFAIARQESAFRPDVKSYAGATGVMQLMPATARYIIRKEKLDEVEVASLNGYAPASPISMAGLNDPVVNITVGQHYITYLREKSYINDNMIHLLTAYNAGPGNAIEWQKRFARVDDPLLFIERIPFRETRHYVMQVMANYMVYSAMLRNEDTAAAKLIEGEWPRFDTLGQAGDAVSHAG
ncbi:MAG: hypothetical protein CMM94_08575 [Rickettsiales bacterium]|nr:hypothetical protein [Rickettsiales bacterium]